MLKQGDIVRIHTCDEAIHYNGMLWVCRTDEFTRGIGVYKENLVFLEGFSGSFMTKYLQNVEKEGHMV